jgi:hypothetical protein
VDVVSITYLQKGALSMETEAFYNYLPEEAVEELDETFARWLEPGFCGLARLLGLIDRYKARMTRGTRVFLLLRAIALPSDGFEQQFAQQFSCSARQARQEVLRAVRDEGVDKLTKRVLDTLQD